jgi:DNA-binding NtrC family response regulator
VRFIAATQRPLANAVAAGRFRQDLQARLEGAVLELPPLRERREEIGPLFMHLLNAELGREPGELDARLVEHLCLYDWPLNVRELSLLVKRLAVLHGGGLAWSMKSMLSELPALEPVAPEPRPSEPRDLREKHDEEAARALTEALERHHGNISRAAAELSITRQRAYRLLKSSKPPPPNQRR